jgi:AraC family transcriptional regulator, melibiose operon regulatory protein
MPSAENTASLGLRCFSGAPPLMGDPHRHNDIEINFMRSGAMTYLFGSSTISLEQGSFGVFWAAMPHRLVSVAQDTRLIWVTVPLALFLKWELPSTLSKAILDGQLVQTTGTQFDAQLLDRWERDLAGGLPEFSRIVQLELEARLMRLALEQPGDGASKSALRTQPGAGASKAERMARYIAEHFHESLRVEQIAKSAHIHPTYAMHLFRETYGVSIIDYLTQHRIAHAQQLLATTDQSVTEISLAAGFNSVSRFYTAFNAICGKSPRAYRESLRVI